MEKKRSCFPSYFSSLGPKIGWTALFLYPSFEQSFKLIYSEYFTGKNMA
jgi:hypothetical protein